MSKRMVIRPPHDFCPPTFRTGIAPSTDPTDSFIWAGQKLPFRSSNPRVVCDPKMVYLIIDVIHSKGFANLVMLMFSNGKSLCN